MILRRHVRKIVVEEIDDLLLAQAFILANTHPLQELVIAISRQYFL